MTAATRCDVVKLACDKPTNHIRFTPRVDLSVGGGVTKSGLLLKDERIAGAAKFPAAWRWMAGAALGFVF